MAASSSVISLMTVAAAGATTGNRLRTPLGIIAPGDPRRDGRSGRPAPVRADGRGREGRVLRRLFFREASQAGRGPCRLVRQVKEFPGSTRPQPGGAAPVSP